MEGDRLFLGQEFTMQLSPEDSSLAGPAHPRVLPEGASAKQAADYPYRTGVLAIKTAFHI